MSYRPVFGSPRLTQDWGTEQHERETHWTSLFYDLMLVAALNALAKPFEEFNVGDEDFDSGDATSSSNANINTNILEPIKYLWLDAALQFFSVVNPWNSLNEYTSMFEDESLVGHLVFFVHCFGIATTAAGCVGEFSENYRDLATGIVLARVGLLVLWARPILYIKRVRVQGLVRCFCLLVTIGMIVWGAASVEGEDDRDAFHRFRMVMVVSVIWEWLSVLSNVTLSKEHRIPFNIKSFSDRFKEITMVIFGEAVFAIVLRPFSDASEDTNYYLALLFTLWLIYSLALQNFHVMPRENDHAMRRSILFGSLWYFTQIFKEMFLLGLSIGIKRAHLLSFVSPSDPVDKDTLNLLVWGFTLTMLAVVLIRSYSFGFGRHPSKDDPPDIYRLKVGWWVVLSATCLIPQFLNRTLFNTFDTPLAVVFIFACMMSLIILAEAVTSNLVAERIKKRLLTETVANEKEVNEMTYLGSKFSDMARVVGVGHTDSGSVHFLCCHGPKSTQK